MYVFSFLLKKLSPTALNLFSGLFATSRTVFRIYLKCP